MVQEILKMAVLAADLLGLILLAALAFSTKLKSSATFLFLLGIFAFVLVAFRAARVIFLPEGGVSLQDLVSSPSLYHAPIYLAIWIVIGALSFWSYGRECRKEGFKQAKGQQVV